MNKIRNICQNRRTYILIHVTDQILCMLQDFDFYYNIIVLLSSTDDDWYQKGVG